MKLFDFHTKAELKLKAARGGKRTAPKPVVRPVEMTVKKPVQSEKNVNWRSKPSAGDGTDGQ